MLDSSSTINSIGAALAAAEAAAPTTATFTPAPARANNTTNNGVNGMLIFVLSLVNIFKKHMNDSRIWYAYFQIWLSLHLKSHYSSCSITCF